MSPARRPADVSLPAQTIALGVTQTIAWASSTYLPAILAQPLARDLRLPASSMFAAFALVLHRRGGGAAIALTASLSLIALAALFLLRIRHADAGTQSAV